MLSLAEFIVWIVGAAVVVLYIPVAVRPAPIIVHGGRSGPAAVRRRRSAFRAHRLTASTFLIVEHDDIYAEHPYIYAKIVPAANTILILDTGCGGASNDPNVEVTSLREFIETVPVEHNQGMPLNEGGRMRYVVALSHCHYDHILGVEQFAVDSPIIESSHAPAFISRANLPDHSHCARLGTRTPSFTPTLVPHRSPVVSATGVPLGVTLLHTPGHTPDELALWDADENMLYVGDTLYEWEPIIFPDEGDIRAWLASVDALYAFVSATGAPQEARINSGHRTALRPALEVLGSTREFMIDVLSGREKVKRRTERRGVYYVEYVQDGGRYWLQCPERLIMDARQSVPL
ncbi:Metallo-hydrolase/oxidoreductase [Amylocystis lapponica]|nr:Metallo-hydrolase/oxidoreductase [Amylocystis lapponica]